MLRFTRIEFKGPTDTLEPGDLAQLLGCAFLWHSQQAEPIPKRDITLIVLAPSVNEAMRDDLVLLEWDATEHEVGVFRLAGAPFTAWLVETDVMGDRGQPVLSLVNPVFLRERGRIIERLKRTGHDRLLCYVQKQIQQFRSLGEDFAMQHRDSEYLGELEEQLQTAVLEAIPAEKRLQGLTADEILRRFTPEELASGLTDEQATRLRELLDARPPKQGH